jgi:hypothetical protein
VPPSSVGPQVPAPAEAAREGLSGLVRDGLHLYARLLVVFQESFPGEFLHRFLCVFPCLAG